jgi:uncharacterized protein YkwD
MRGAALALAAAFALHASAQTARPPAADVSAAASLIVERTNEFRRAEGLDAVHVDARLERAALEFAQFMARTGKYGHEADGRDPPARAQAQGYEYCVVLENIAYHYDSRGYEARRLAQASVEGWKASPPHRKNLENPLVTQTGVAVARAANGYYYSVQMLGLPRSASVAFEVRNESHDTVRYRVGDTAYAIPPRSIRTHTTCMHEALRFAGGEALQPRRGDRFIIPPEGGPARLQPR